MIGPTALDPSIPSEDFAVHHPATNARLVLSREIGRFARHPKGKQISRIVECMDYIV